MNDVRFWLNRQRHVPSVLCDFQVFKNRDVPCETESPLTSMTASRIVSESESGWI